MNGDRIKVNEVLVRIIAEQERVLEHMRAEGIPVREIQESIERLRNMLAYETRAIESAQIDGVEEVLVVGMVFDNFKKVCVFNGLLEAGASTPKGNTKKSLEKELNTICKWHKEGQKIIIDEVYQQQLQKEDKRRAKNTYVDIVEAITLYQLNNSSDQRFYFSIGAMGEVLGIFNQEFKNLRYYDNDTLKEFTIVRSFKMNAKGEAKKIIDRALKSMKDRRVIDFAYGRVIILKDDSLRMSTVQEMELLTNIEEGVLSSLGCYSYTQMEVRKLKKKFMQKVREEAEARGVDEFKSSFNGYTIVSNKDSTDKAISEFQKKEKSKMINVLFQNKIKSVATSKHNSAVRKLKKSVVFGEGIAQGEALENYISDIDDLIKTYIALD